jgi:hypothetical protein
MVTPSDAIPPGTHDLHRLGKMFPALGAPFNVRIEHRDECRHMLLHRVFSLPRSRPLPENPSRNVQRASNRAQGDDSSCILAQLLTDWSLERYLMLVKHKYCHCAVSCRHDATPVPGHRGMTG